MLTHYVSPGLPTYPHLMFDAQQQRAYVCMVHPTWRSYERARVAARAIATVVILTALNFVWSFTAYMDPLLRILAIYFGGLLLGIPAGHYVCEAIWGFLSRRVFPRKLECWFTPQAIGIRSDMFPDGIVLWRTWNTSAVIAKFSLSADVDAKIQSHAKQKRPPGLRFHFETARVLRITLGVETLHRPMQGGNANAMRAISICEIDEANAERANMVLATAAALTSEQRPHERPSTTSVGHDIDLQ